MVKAVRNILETMTRGKRMSVNFKVGVRRTNLIVVSLVVSVIFSLAVAAQNNANKVLDENAVMALLNQLADGLGDLVEDEEQTNSIVEKWNAREGLEGKTRAQILPLLFADVQAVINDPTTRTKIWRAWNPPEQAATVPKPAATPVAAQNSQALDEVAAFDLADDLKRRFAGLVSGRRIPNANITWTELNNLTGKTRAEIMRLLFADVQAVITDPASRTLVWNEWNRPATPPAQKGAPQPLPQTPVGYLAIVTQGGKDDQLITENIPLLKWDVTIVDGLQKPIAGARVSIRLTSGATGDNVFRSINGKSVEAGITQTATTNAAGTCSFSIPWTRNARYELTVANSQGTAFKYIDGIPYDGAPIIKDFTWDSKWEASRTMVVETAEGYAKNHATELAQKQADQNAIAQILLRPADDWTRTGWTPEWAEKAIEINATFNAPVNDGLRAKFTNYHRTLGAINVLKLALTPASFDGLKRLNTFVQSQPRSNQNAVVSVDIGGKDVDLSVPFKQVPDAKVFQACKQKAAAGEAMTPDCGRALASVVPYQNRWNAINLSCLANRDLVPIANELNALVSSRKIFEAGLIKDEYPLTAGVELSKNHPGIPPDARGWVCSALIKNEMAKDMSRDGFPTDVLNAVIGEQLEEDWPPLTSANFAGKSEKASDPVALLNLFRSKNEVGKYSERDIGSVKRSRGETVEAFRARVVATLNNTFDPASGRRLDDSIFVFRARTLYGGGPNELKIPIGFLRLGPVRFFSAYGNGFDLTIDGERTLDVSVVFSGKVRPGQPVPDKRDLAIAVYGWTIGAQETDSEGIEQHIGFVMKRWVMYNIHTGEVYGTSEPNGDGKYSGQLFR